MGSLVAFPNLAEFVCIKQDRAVYVLPAGNAASVLRSRPLDHRERVATPKNDGVQVHLPVPLLHKAREKRHIAALAFALTTQKNAVALGNSGAA